MAAGTKSTRHDEAIRASHRTHGIVRNAPASDAQELSALEHHTNRVISARQTSERLGDAVRQIADRVVGPAPESRTDTNEADKPSSTLTALSGAIERLDDALRYLEANIERIARV